MSSHWGKILAPPKEVSGLPRCGKDIVAKLKKKGIGEGPKLLPLPAYFNQVLKSMNFSTAKPAGEQAGDA